jgi:predicted GNAT family acetyltransferase
MAEEKSFTITMLDSRASSDKATLSLTVQAVLDLSNRIFNTASSSPTPTHHSSLDEWSRRLSLPGSVLVFGHSNTTDTDMPPSSPSSQPPHTPMPMLEPGSGFIFAHPRRDSALTGAGPMLLHIWLAGVDKPARGTGIFAALMEQVEEHARQSGFETLGVCTYPERFGRMFAILRRTGWVETEWLEEGKKVRMMKRV